MPEPPLDLIWFNVNDEISDFENVLNFLGNLPFNLEFLFGQQSFQDLFQNTNESKYDLNYNLFRDSMYEAFSILKSDLEYFRRRSFSYQYRNRRTRLENIGFTGASLRLKANLLNRLWEKVIKAADGFINFANNTVVKAIRKFLKYLNSMLGSLKELIPGVEAIKELKECGEGFLDLVKD